jgi:hypothetical protein
VAAANWAFLSQNRARAGASGETEAMTLRHFFFNNFFLKLFSVAAGTIIWLAIHRSITNNLDFSEPTSGQRLIKQTFNIPISLVKQEGDPRNFIFSPTNMATLTVVGEMSALRNLDQRNIKILVDVSDFTGVGPVQMDLYPEAPKELNVIAFKPRSVTVTVESNTR